MAAIWAVGEVADGVPSKLTLELATLARQLAEKANGESKQVLIGKGASDAAKEAAAYGDVIAIDADPGTSPVASLIAPKLAALVGERNPDVLLFAASSDGKDACGLFIGLTDWPVLVNASGVDWTDGGPSVEMSTFGGKLVTHSAFVDGKGAIVVRPATVAAEKAASPGNVESTTVEAEELPTVTVVESVAEEGASASIEEARIIVGGGRGVGNEQGFKLVQDLADALGGAVGATRAVVDSGWIAYSQQIGQTGKIVKPALYVACGISGAIQHKVGVQTAGTIVAINRDADAPIAEFADLFVVGDLFEILPLLTQAIIERKTGGSPSVRKQ
jgi:electron transfer flavoprotein alpha subunit